MFGEPILVPVHHDILCNDKVMPAISDTVIGYFTTPQALRLSMFLIVL
jgi:hypothetical protein